MLPHQVHHFGDVSRLDQQFKPGLQLLQFANHAGQEVLAGRRRRADAQPRLTPLAEAFQRLPGRLQSRQGRLDLSQQLFARLVEKHLPARPLEQPAAQLRLQRLKAVADRRRSQVQFGGSGHQAAALGHRAKHLQQSCVHFVSVRADVGVNAGVRSAPQHLGQWRRAVRRQRLLQSPLFARPGSQHPAARAAAIGP